MSVGELLMCLGESRQPISPHGVTHHSERDRAGGFKGSQRLERRGDVGLQSSLNGYADEAQLRDRTGAKGRGCSGQGTIPSKRSSMMNVRGVPESDEHIDIEQELHGKSAKMVRTSSLVTVGPFAGPLVIISPVA